jgi:hypothetical protein
MVKSHKVAPFLFLLLFSCVQKNLLPDAKDAKRTTGWFGLEYMVLCVVDPPIPRGQ